MAADVSVAWDLYRPESAQVGSATPPTPQLGILEYNVNQAQLAIIVFFRWKRGRQREEIYDQMERKEWKIEAWMCAELKEGEAALLLVWMVWLCRVVNVKKVSRESRRKVFVQNQRCSEALTWLSLARGEGRIKFFCEHGLDTSEWNHPCWGPALCFIFLFSLLEMLEAVDTAWLWLPVCVL